MLALHPFSGGVVYDGCGLDGSDAPPSISAFHVETVDAVTTPRRPGPSLSSTRGGAMDFLTAWATYRTHLLVGRDASPATVEEYRSRLFHWHRFLDGQGVAWEAADPDLLQRFLGRTAAAGRRRGQPLSTNMRHNDVVAVTGFYRFATLAGILDRDPMALVHPPRRREGPPRSFPIGQLKTILAGARSDDRLYLLVWLGFGEGLRRAEMAGLDLADFERDPWPGRLRVLGKGGRERWLPLSAKVRAVLDRHLGDRANLVAGPLVANHRFPAQPLRPGTVGDLLAAHIRACGIEQGSGHWLRHDFAYLALDAEQGRNLEELREAMGHTDSRVTRLYAKRYAWQVRARVIDVLPNPEERP